MSEKLVEIFRVLRYVGTPEFISVHTTNRYVKGRREMGGGFGKGGCFIEEAFLGETPKETEDEV